MCMIHRGHYEQNDFEIFYIILSIRSNRPLTQTEDDPIPTFLTTVGNTSAEYT